MCDSVVSYSFHTLLHPVLLGDSLARTVMMTGEYAVSGGLV